MDAPNVSERPMISRQFCSSQSSISLIAKLFRGAGITDAAFILKNANCNHNCFMEGMETESTPYIMQPLSKIIHYTCSVTRTFHGLPVKPEI